MLIIKENEALHRSLALLKNEGGKIGFVPTMGALHEGHLALVRGAKKTCGVAVCSIFVNPTQFNNASDLANYPRTSTRDIEALLRAKCDLLYLPNAEAIYPPGLNTQLNLDPGSLTQVMEGAFRPGHFEGVMQVVWRLLDLVQPDQLFMGQKDFQQVAVIDFMLKAMKSKVKLVRFPTIREEDGLAMSSRNERLTPEDRFNAPAIVETFQWAASVINKISPREIEEKAMARLAENGLQPDYFILADASTLQPIDQPNNHKTIIAFAAAFAGNVRLIDNWVVKGTL